MNDFLFYLFTYAAIITSLLQKADFNFRRPIPINSLVQILSYKK